MGLRGRRETDATRQRGGQLVVQLLAVVLLVGIVSGCVGTDDDAGRLRSALDELSSVGGPDGHDAADLTVVSCGDDAEMPAGYAGYDHEGLDPSNVDAFNAELVKIGKWYLPRWRTLGWNVDEAKGPATKRVDGTRLRAVIELGKGTGYAIVVVKDRGGLCG